MLILFGPGLAKEVRNKRYTLGYCELLLYMGHWCS